MKLKALLIIVMIAASEFCAAQTNLQEQLPIDKNVKIGKLKNGLTYYIRKNAKPEKKLELRLVINAGSILEDDDQQGLAHFTEHMAFNGSSNFQKNDIVSFLQSIGVEFGADLNAYTGFDETVYILPIPTEKKENVEKGFQILQDWASTITFDDQELEKERGVVLEEERMGKGADERMFRKTYPKMFEGSKYADRLPIGKPEVIKSFKKDVIKRFYSDWYRPDLMAVIAVGDYDPIELEDLIKKNFSTLKNPAKAKPRNQAEVFPRKNSEGVVVTDKEATNHVVEIRFSNQPTTERKTLADYRTHYIIRRICKEMLNQRFQELTQKADPPFIFGGSFVGGWARNYESFNSIAYVGTGGADASIKALIQENERARRFGFTAGELERTKKRLLKGMESSFNEREKTESYVFVDEYVQHFLEREPIPGIENEFNYVKRFLESITIDEVNREAAQLIPDAKHPKLVIFTGPDSAAFKIPTNEQLVTMVDEAALLPIEPYQDKQIATTLIEDLPPAGTLIDEQMNDKLRLSVLTLSNGIKVILKPTDFKNDEVVMLGSRLGGQYLFESSARENIEYAVPAVAQMGIGNFSPVDLGKFLAGKDAHVMMRIGSTTESFSAQCGADDVELMMQLTHLNFTAPRKDEELFNSFISKQTSYYQNMGHDPEYIFQDSLLRTLYKNHPWAPRLPKVETFSKIKIDEVLKNYKSRFGNAYGFNIVMVGNFDPEKVKPMIVSYLSSLPAEKYSPSVKDVGLRPVRGVVKKEIKKGSEPKSLIRMYWSGETTFSEQENLILSTLIDLLNIKITESLREEMSGVYSGDVYGSLNKYPYENYSIGMSLPCGPENVQTLIDAALAEVTKIKEKGPLESDLSKVKETKKQKHLVDIKDNSYWARRIIQSLELNSNPENILTFEERLNSITTKDLQNFAIKYFNMQNYVQVVLKPEN